MERCLPIALLALFACDEQSAELLSSRASQDLGFEETDAGGSDLGPPPEIDLERDLLIHQPFDLDQPSNLGPQSVPACARPPGTEVQAGEGVLGDALVSTATTGCQNRNTDEWLPREGPWTVAFFFRVDAPAPPGEELRGFELKSLFRLFVNDADELRVNLNRERIRRTLLAPVAGTGWYAFALRVDPDRPRAEVFLNGRRVEAIDERIGLVSPENGGIAAWVGAMDELRTYGRWLGEAELSRLAEK